MKDPLWMYPRRRAGTTSCSRTAGSALDLHVIGLGRRQTLRAGGSWGQRCDAEADGRGWIRIAGIEIEESVAEIPYLCLPATRIHAGLARVLNGPSRSEWRAWLIMGYAP